MSHRNAPVALTMGDPAGVGPELVIKLCAASGALPAPVVIGDAQVLEQTAASLGVAIDVRPIAEVGRGRDRAGVIDVLEPSPPVEDPRPGQIDPHCGRAAYDYVCHGIELALGGDIAGLVTNPINKAAWAAAGIDYPGHTELLAERCGVDDVAMMLVNRELRVVLVSIHCALAEAIDRITFEAEMKAIERAHEGARACGIEHPRVAVAGLNPHAGEGGLFGREEIDVIAPAVHAARERGIDASGPWPGDTVFMQARAGHFDVVVAQYHDQGLIPVKYLGVDDGVNVTLGLPFVRTSPDHGTAFDIAGRGIASPHSLGAALALAHTLAEVGAGA